VLCNFSLAAVDHGRRLGYNVSYHRYAAGSVEKNNTMWQLRRPPRGGRTACDGRPADALLKEVLGW
jgi:hypothetical protein